MSRDLIRSSEGHLIARERCFRLRNGNQERKKRLHPNNENLAKMTRFSRIGVGY